MVSGRSDHAFHVDKGIDVPAKGTTTMIRALSEYFETTPLTLAPNRGHTGVGEALLAHAIAFGTRIVNGHPVELHAAFQSTTTTMAGNHLLATPLANFVTGVKNWQRIPLDHCGVRDVSQQCLRLFP